LRFAIVGSDRVRVDAHNTWPIGVVGRRVVVGSRGDLLRRRLKLETTLQ
jgi:hypothetical protein